MTKDVQGRATEAEQKESWLWQRERVVLTDRLIWKLRERTNGIFSIPACYIFEVAVRLFPIYLHDV